MNKIEIIPLSIKHIWILMVLITSLCVVQLYFLFLNFTCSLFELSLVFAYSDGCCRCCCSNCIYHIMFYRLALFLALVFGSGLTLHVPWTRTMTATLVVKKLLAIFHTFWHTQGGLAIAGVLKVFKVLSPQREPTCSPSSSWLETLK